ncbi:MAG: NlpC/P60 family protein [Frankiales bacterium]|nr:NlpC/P60 family protein [Frankiales bacterium]
MKLAVCSAAVTALVLTCGAPVSAAPKPPPNPSNQQLSAAQAAKNNMAAQVGRLSALLAQAQNQLAQLTYKKELAEQKWAQAVFALDQAKAQAIAAQQAVVAAQTQITAAQASLKNFVRNSYIQPNATSGATSLLTATDPNALLQTGDYVNFIATRHLDAMSSLDRATVAKSNADAKARQAVLLQQRLTTAAANAKDAALAAVQAEQQQQAMLQQQSASYQSQLAAAQLKLANLNGQRAKYLAYQKEQARLAAIRARQAALRRAAAARAAAAAAAAANNNNTQSGDNTYLPPANSMGGWTAAKGNAAVARALHTLGTPYAWAGGGYNGPTYGVNSPGTDGWNDSAVYGYDCSGLSMYAWAPQGLYMAHYAATQYTQAGSYHPSAGNFQPGDLLFWSGDGSIGGIHHVAIYIGNGNVIQAPNSGSYVQITPWDQVSPDYFGATRPLT